MYTLKEKTAVTKKRKGCFERFYFADDIVSINDTHKKVLWTQLKWHLLLKKARKEGLPYSYIVSTVIMFDLFQDFFWKSDLFYDIFLYEYGTCKHKTPL